MVKLKKIGKSVWSVAKDPSITIYKCTRRFRSGEWYVVENGDQILWSHYKHVILQNLEELTPELAA